MEERKFVIKEIYEGEDPKSIYWITESELKRRIELIFNYVNKDDGDLEPVVLTPLGARGAIDILLHGEQKDKPQTKKGE